MTVPQTRNIALKHIGILAALPVSPTFAVIQQTIEEELRKAGLEPLHVLERDIALRTEKALALWNNHEIAGAIHIGSNDVSELWEIPLIVVGQTENGNGFGEVSVDNIKAGRRVGQHLWELGHRRIGVFMPEHFVSQLRTEGLRACWLHYGGRWNENDEIKVQSYENIKLSADWKEEEMQYYLNRAFTHTESPTALFCFNDDAAASAIRILRSLGKRVPEDVSVIGFDDGAIERDPPLTTIRMPGIALGRAAVHQLLLQLSDPKIKLRPMRLPAELIVRASSGPAPSLSLKPNRV